MAVTTPVRRPLTRVLAAVTGLAAAVALSGCGGGASADDASDDVFPDEIVLGAVPAENSTDMKDGYDPLIKLRCRCGPAGSGKMSPRRYRASASARRDAAVEPREVPRALRTHLICSGLYSFHSDVEIVDISDREGSVRLTDARGRDWEGDQAILCTGAWHSGVAAPWLADVERPPVRGSGSR